MKKNQGAIVIDSGQCKGCELCTKACPHDVIAMARKVNVHGYRYAEAVNGETCVGCTACAIVCPDGCITVYRKRTM